MSTQQALPVAGWSERISNGQAVLLIIGAILAVTVFVLPGPAIELAGNDAYLSTMLATGVSFVEAYLFFVLARGHRWSGPLQYLTTIFGKWIGKVLGAVYMAYFVLVAATVGQEIPKVLGAVIMPLTPQWAFVLPTVLASAYIAYLGLENFARLAQLMVPFLLTVIVALPFMAWQFADPGYLLPIMKDGWGPVLKGMAVPLGIRGEGAVLLAFLLPHMKSPRRGFRAGTFTASVIALLLAFNTIGVTVVFSPAIAAKLALPTLSLARISRLAAAVQHLEALVVAPWLLALVMKAALYSYFVAVGLCVICGLSDWRPLILPVSAFIGVLGMYLYPSSAAIDYVFRYIRPGLTLTVALGLPLLAAALHYVRGALSPNLRQPGAGS